MRIIKVSCPGKIHLSGEHSVVYGEPALLSAVNKRLTIILKERKDYLINIKYQKSIPRLTNIITFQNLKFNARKSLILFAINKVYQILGRKPKSGFNLEIKSEIPIGSGMGSSAALSAALSGAIMKFENITGLSLEKINNIAYEIEKKQHGKPSGGDNTIICFGGLLKFKKDKNNKFKFKQLNLDKDCKFPEFTLVFSGKPQETTGEMVNLVNAKLKCQELKLQLKTQNTIRNIGKISKKIINCFKKGELNKLIPLIKQNEKLLEELGVVGKKAKKIIRKIEKIGGSAKICGAGGIKKGSGMILAYHPNLNKLKLFFKKNRLKFMKIKFKEEGIKIDEKQ